jgi:hypothetical protein
VVGAAKDGPAAVDAVDVDEIDVAAVNGGSWL